MHWILMGVGWLVLLIRPSVGVIGWLSLLLAISLSAIGFTSTPSTLWAGAVGEALGHTLVFAIGAAFIVAIRGDKSGARSGKKLDKEMERIRADIAARDGEPPVAQ